MLPLRTLDWEPVTNFSAPFQASELPTNRHADSRPWHLRISSIAFSYASKHTVGGDARPGRLSTYESILPRTDYHEKTCARSGHIEKQIDEFPAFYGTKNLHYACTRIFSWSLSDSIQTLPLFFSRSILILSYHLRLSQAPSISLSFVWSSK